MRISDILKRRPEILESGAIGITTLVGEIIIPRVPAKHECKGCAKCCVYDPDIIDKEVTAIAKFLGSKRDDFAKRLKMKKKISGLGFIWGFDKKLGEPCPFLKDNRCAIYEVRPLACRLYPYQVRWDGEHFILQPYCDTGQPNLTIKSKEDLPNMGDSRCENWEYSEELRDQEALLIHLEETVRTCILFVLERLSAKNARKLKDAWKERQRIKDTPSELN